MANPETRATGSRFFYSISGPRRANVVHVAKSGEELDRIVRDYHALGGRVHTLRIVPVLVEEALVANSRDT